MVFGSLWASPLSLVVLQVWYAAHYAEHVGVKTHQVSEADQEGKFIVLQSNNGPVDLGFPNIHSRGSSANMQNYSEWHITCETQSWWPQPECGHFWGLEL